MTPTFQPIGTPGTYEVQATSNFLNWTAVRTVNTANGTLIFSDPTATNASARFFRTAQ